MGTLPAQPSCALVLLETHLNSLSLILVSSVFPGQQFDLRHGQMC